MVSSWGQILFIPVFVLIVAVPWSRWAFFQAVFNVVI